MSITYVVFGATGDLAQRKIMPALLQLYTNGSLPKDATIVAYSRRAWADEEYRGFIRPALTALPEQVEAFLLRVVYVAGTFEDISSYTKLLPHVAGRRTYYHLAVLPAQYEPIVEGLGAAGLPGSVLVDKPFGTSLTTALALEAHMERYFLPQDILRIDHYLGKSGLLAFKHAKATSAQLAARLSREQVTRVECCLLESLDAAGRGAFYDSVGALRDVVQNHLLQMLVAVLATGDTPEARAEALMQLVPEAQVVRAQYEGYTQEEGVAPHSTTETYVSMVLQSKDPRWVGVPLMLVSGKALAEKRSHIRITFADGEVYVCDLENPSLPEAYAYVIGSVLAGNPLVVSFEEVCAAWRLTDRVKEILETAELLVYPKGVNIEELAKQSTVE